MTGVEWRPIETAPANRRVVLGWWLLDIWQIEVNWARSSNGWEHSFATHWMYPEPPERPAKAPSVVEEAKE